MPGGTGRRLLILTGPTAVGKTAVGVEAAERLGTEIVSADSMAVYRRMEAATAKPDAAQRSRVRHHLVDVADPTEPFNVARYRALAVPVLERLIAEGKTPLVVGGTRLYLAALTESFTPGPPPSPRFRESLAATATPALYERLRNADPETAARLQPADRKRIVRALEVLETSGDPLSQWQRRSREQPGLFSACWIGLYRDRQELYRRVDERVDRMIEQGLIEEVRGFLAEGLTAETPAMQGHGYKEILRALTGEYALAEGIRLLKRNTRRYVKYQLMWMRGRAELVWVNAAREVEDVATEVVARYRAE